MIGVDIGGSHIKAVRVVGDSVETQRQAPRSESRWLDETADLIRSFDIEESAKRPPVGVGVAGLVDHEAGRLLWAPHIAGVNVEVGAELQRQLGRMVAVDNDANCAALAESHLGPGINAKSVMTVMVGTGIGMGLVIGGEVFRGRALAGEAGHMTMVPDGNLCPCGRRGCWETVVSGWKLAQQWGSGEPTATAIAAFARSGDRRASQILDEAGRWLGRGLANLIAVLDPEVVVVGGGVIEGAGSEILSPARSEIARVLEGAEHRMPTPIVRARFGIWAGAVGAALLPTGRGSAAIS